MSKIRENDCSNYQRTQMQKENVIQILKERGYRITKQRQIILDIILGNDCSCCKEIYYRASLQDKGIGVATVYRMVGVLEEIGAISRRITHHPVCKPECKTECKIDCLTECQKSGVCIVYFDNNTTLELSGQEWERIMHEGLCACGYAKNCSIQNIVMN